MMTRLAAILFAAAILAGVMATFGAPPPGERRCDRCPRATILFF